jgi:hypothetical protein
MCRRSKLDCHQNHLNLIVWSVAGQIHFQLIAKVNQKKFVGSMSEIKNLGCFLVRTGCKIKWSKGCMCCHCGRILPPMAAVRNSHRWHHHYCCPHWWPRRCITLIKFSCPTCFPYVTTTMCNLPSLLLASRGAIQNEMKLYLHKLVAAWILLASSLAMSPSASEYNDWFFLLLPELWQTLDAECFYNICPDLLARLSNRLMYIHFRGLMKSVGSHGS